MKLDKVKKIYMIGIKGVGMTMLAQFLKEKGYDISGSDTAETFMTDEILRKYKIDYSEGFDEKNIPVDADLIVYSTAYTKETNVEVAFAQKNRKNVLTYFELLGDFFKSKYGIAVAGSHGKTTTTAWLGYVLDRCGKSPSVMVAARVPQFDGASLVGKSDIFVIEADEYQNKLKYYDAKAVLLNNIDYDHPDYFPTKEDYEKVFIDFIKKIPKKGFLVANFDDDVIRKCAYVNSRARVISYAINEAADYVAFDIRHDGRQQYFKVKMSSHDFFEEEEPSENLLGDFVISLPGRHNVYNALAVIAASIELEVELHELRRHLEDFTGTARRMDFLGQYRGAKIIDDYAHHPSEIQATLSAVRDMYPDSKLRAVFHPHTFTRTKGLLNDFAKSFDWVDELIILDIYGSAREKQGGVHSLDLVEKIKSEMESGKPSYKQMAVRYIPDLKEVENYLRDTINDGEIILLLGAGDVFRIGQNLLK